MSTLTTTDLWIDLYQGTTDRGSRGSERAYGYVGTEEEYEDADGDSLAYCGWFFLWPDARQAKELTEAEIEAMVESLERDETASHREAIPLAMVEEVLRAEIEPRKVVVTIYFDDQDAANEGWAARKVGPHGEDTTAIDAKDEDAAKAEAAKHYGVSVEAVTIEACSMDVPKTLIEAVRYFADLDRCEELMRKMRWPTGTIRCPECDSTNVGEIKTRRLLRCRDCRRQIYTKRGTIFEDSPLGLDKWFAAVWSIANCKNGISSHELARALGVTQKTAWFMLHRIRVAMEIDDGDKFGGPTEADTTYVGGRAENMHKSKREKIIKGRGAVGKTPVHAVLQRGTADQPSQVRTIVVSREDGETLIGEIRRRVKPGALVCTDEARAYEGLAATHVHAAIDHSRAYVDGHIHTNGVENFWSLLKRTLGGTYVAVAPFHLCRYVAEQVERFNSRELTDGERFASVLARVFGRRLTYRILTGQDGAGFMGLT